MQLAAEVFKSTYTAPHFGRDGLTTRDPIYLFVLENDEHFAPYGDSRMHQPDIMIEWLVMKRSGLSLDDAKLLCRRERMKMVVIARRECSFTGSGVTLRLQPGDQLEFVYGIGLSKATTGAGALQYGGADEGPSPGGGGDHRPERPSS